MLNDHIMSSTLYILDLDVGNIRAYDRHYSNRNIIWVMVRTILFIYHILSLVNLYYNFNSNSIFILGIYSLVNVNHITPLNIILMNDYIELMTLLIIQPSLHMS